MASYLIVIGKEAIAQNHSAFSPDVPGCITVGDTVEETLVHTQEAQQTHLEGMGEDGDDLPSPLSLEEHLSQSPELRLDSLIFARIPDAEVSPLQYS